MTVGEEMSRRRTFTDSPPNQPQLPTPQLTPPLGSPLPAPFVPTEETLFEASEEPFEGGSASTAGDASKTDASILHLDGATFDPSLSPQPYGTRGNAHRRRDGETFSPIEAHSRDANSIRKLSPQKIEELTKSPLSLPIAAAFPIQEEGLYQTSLSTPSYVTTHGGSRYSTDTSHDWDDDLHNGPKLDGRRSGQSYNIKSGCGKESRSSRATEVATMPGLIKVWRPGMPERTVSTPPTIRRKHSHKSQASRADGILSKKSHVPPPLDLKDMKQEKVNGSAYLQTSPLPAGEASPIPAILPMPPMSIPTFLQLEMASDRPSPLYIHRSSVTDLHYESSAIKFERLENFLLLPPQLERVLWFGAIACLDAWLYTFTILPLRFFKAIGILAGWWLRSAWEEFCYVIEFVYLGIGRLWRRGLINSQTGSSDPSGDETSRSQSMLNIDGATPSEAPRQISTGVIHAWPDPPPRRRRKNSIYRHRRTRSSPSLLQPSHKADLLKGLLVLLSCFVLMKLDPSRMYHNIRGQAAIKLYVIYNVLEVADRLLSAIGQDILECLFSQETLERGPDGRSKLIRPLWIFIIALIYNVTHAAALFYQVITLNVAVNSYSNALLTLLMSNQFVEIKGTVFKKIEKDNLFQLTCADVVERFQLWLMLLIIAMRNIVEVGGLNFSLSSSFDPPPMGINNTSTPFSASSIIPKSFTFFPKWTGQVLGPFLLVLGSEMLVDWLKHAYISKFNNTKPNIYGRFLDILSKDYYSNAFGDQNLVKRLGLPVYALACLFIRASIQTYHMFLATHMPLPFPSTATSLAFEAESEATTPATTAALAHIDKIFRRALGRSTFGPASESTPASLFNWWSIDDIIAFTTMLLVFLVLYLVLLASKLVLGMVLLSLSRRRYKGMKRREHAPTDTRGKRLGGWGVTEVDEDKKRWIFADDEEGYRKGKERDKKLEALRGKDVDFERVTRYDMVAKRIW